MLKRWAVLAIISTATFGLSGQENKRPGLPEHNGESYGSPVISFVNNETCAPDHGASNAQPPRWYTQPEWWLCILSVPTLAFIGWQARATAKAADATRVQAEISRNAFISQFRPKVPVRTMWLMENDGALKIEFWLTNIGGTPAHITRSDITAAWEVPAELKRKILAHAAFQPISLQPGQDHSAIVDITEISIPYEVDRIAVDEMGRDQGGWIYCFGSLTYLDDNGNSRSTGFFRKYNIKRKRFIPSDDPEEEYAD